MKNERWIWLFTLAFAVLLLTGCNGKTEELTAQLEAARAETESVQEELGRVQEELESKTKELEETQTALENKEKELKSAAQELNEVKEQVLIPQLKEEAAAVSAAIAALGDGKVSLSQEKNIEAIRSQYDALSADARKYVDNYTVLTTAEATIQELYANQSEEEKEQAFKAECKTYSYNEIARNPDDYIDTPAKLRGKVVQIQETQLLGSTYYVMRVNITKGKYTWSDTVYATYFPKSGENRILTDDIITMWGTLQGTETYTTVLGASVTIPKEALIKSTCADWRADFSSGKPKSRRNTDVFQGFLAQSRRKRCRQDVRGDLFSASLKSAFRMLR